MFVGADQADHAQLFEQFLEQQRITRPEFDIVMRINANLRKVAEPLLAGKINDEALQEAFRALYGEKVKVRHIQAANLQEIQEARRRLEKEPFENVARELSRNARTKASGGELPEFSRATGGLPDAFKDAAFALKEGDVSDPIMADGAYHLIKLEKRIAPTAVKFEDVKESIRSDLHERAIQATVRDLRVQIGRQALEQLKIEVPALQRQFDERREKQKKEQEGQLTDESAIRRQWERERKQATQGTTQPAEEPVFTAPDKGAVPAAPGGAQ
jgi:parvulin-like peptidyl-prolyl isomerase